MRLINKWFLGTVAGLAFLVCWVFQLPILPIDGRAAVSAVSERYVTRLPMLSEEKTTESCTDPAAEWPSVGEAILIALGQHSRQATRDDLQVMLALHRCEVEPWGGLGMPLETSWRSWLNPFSRRLHRVFQGEQVRSSAGLEVFAEDISLYAADPGLRQYADDLCAIFQARWPENGAGVC